MTVGSREGPAQAARYRGPSSDSRPYVLRNSLELVPMTTIPECGVFRLCLLRASILRAF